MKIDELSKLSMVSKRTIRFYEEKGLIQPTRESNSNYRNYQTKDIDTLQMILFYKRLGFELSDIKDLIMNHEIKKVDALETHLKTLEKEKENLEVLINTIKKTILYERGALKMTNKEKFEGFKQQLLDENDQKYQKEVTAKYGDEAYNKSRNAFKNMSEQDYQKFEALSKDIITYLLEAYKAGASPTSEYAIKAAKAHQVWITKAWGSYNQEAHLNVVDMYVTDERFKQYYDQHQEGLANLLRDAVYQLLLNE